jgi:hypothetical protein
MLGVDMCAASRSGSYNSKEGAASKIMKLLEKIVPWKFRTKEIHQ